MRCSPAAPAALALGLVLALAATPALAQYKIVGPDGRITYTDKAPPPATRGGVAPSPGAGAAAAAPAGGGLPAELRQPMARYPVTLYTTAGCAPCDQARSWLKARGIPYTEYTVNTAADAQALQARVGERNLPMITFGKQLVRGFSASELQGFADAAGYPATSRLAGWQAPPALPLAPPAAVLAQPEPASAPPAEPAFPPRDDGKPSIRF